MRKPPRSNLAQVAATLRNGAGDQPGMPIEFRRRLVADLCKLLADRAGTPSPSINPTPSAPPVDASAAPLPPRLQQTLDHLLTGDSEKQIARKLAISPHTVHVYVKSLYKRFDVSSRGELLARWVQR